MVKKYEIDALCAVNGCDKPVKRFWQGRCYCKIHDPLAAPTEKTKKPAQVRSPADRAKNAAKQKRYRDKKNLERAELLKLHASKRQSPGNHADDDLFTALGTDESN